MVTPVEWLGYTAARHHDYTHRDGKAPGYDGPDGQRVMRDICRWHVEEFAYLIGKLKSIKEGDGTLLDNCMIVYGGGIADGNAHAHHDLPILLAGRGGGQGEDRGQRGPMQRLQGHS